MTLKGFFCYDNNTYNLTKCRNVRGLYTFNIIPLSIKMQVAIIVNKKNLKKIRRHDSPFSQSKYTKNRNQCTVGYAIPS